MSKADQWAQQVEAIEAEMAAAVAAQPPALAIGGMNATVTPKGGVHLDREIELSHDDALALGEWIVATYS